jgi:hypothetical protein
MEDHAAVARAEPLLTAAAPTARAERRTAPITTRLRVKRGIVVQAEVLLLEMEPFVFVIAHARLAGLARVEKVQMKAFVAGEVNVDLAVLDDGSRRHCAAYPLGGLTFPTLASTRHNLTRTGGRWRGLPTGVVCSSAGVRRVGASLLLLRGMFTRCWR